MSHLEGKGENGILLNMQYVYSYLHSVSTWSKETPKSQDLHYFWNVQLYFPQFFWQLYKGNLILMITLTSENLDWKPTLSSCQYLFFYSKGEIQRSQFLCMNTWWGFKSGLSDTSRLLWVQLWGNQDSCISCPGHTTNVLSFSLAWPFLWR